MSYNNSLITAEETTTNAISASGVFGLQDQYTAIADGEWPLHLGTFDVIFRLRVLVAPFNFTINRAGAGPVTYDIDWGDGTTGNSTNVNHTYTQTGFFDVGITTTNSYPFQLNSTGTTYDVVAYATSSTFSMTSSRPEMNEFEFLSSLSYPNAAFATLTSLEASFNFPSLQEFPLLDLSSCTNFENTWNDCKLLKSFPACDVSSGTNFGNTWRSCFSLKEFPLLDVSSGTDFERSWQYCRNLKTFPSLNFSNATTFRAGWNRCVQLSSFPANMFDSTGTLASNAFQVAFQYCSLSAQSIENILTSLDTNGATGVQLHLDQGYSSSYSTWSSAAQTALSNLQGKSWTVTYNS